MRFILPADFSATFVAVTNSSRRTLETRALEHAGLLHIKRPLVLPGVKEVLIGLKTAPDLITMNSVVLGYFC